MNLRERRKDYNFRELINRLHKKNGCGGKLCPICNPDNLTGGSEKEKGHEQRIHTTRKTSE